MISGCHTLRSQRVTGDIPVEVLRNQPVPHTATLEVGGIVCPPSGPSLVPREARQLVTTFTSSLFPCPPTCSQTTHSSLESWELYETVFHPELLLTRQGQRASFPGQHLLGNLLQRALHRYSRDLHNSLRVALEQ